MKYFRKSLVLVFLSIFLLASCNNKYSANRNVLSSDIESQDAVNLGQKKPSKIEKKHPYGKAYEVGVTPDDYNMDYDTSRLKDLSSKKSPYYPKDGVRGLYFNTYNISNPDVFNHIMDLLETTDLNTVVVDIKDDWGNITCKFSTKDKDIIYATNAVFDAEEFVKKMHEKKVYLIGRITTFKDSIITEKHPDWGFKRKDGSLWKNSSGEAFMNPFLNDVRDYDIKIAELAAMVGFDEIQFDYIRFPEAFETFEKELNYSKGDFEKANLSGGDMRVMAISSFVQRAREELQNYNIPVGIDVFGYAMQVGRADGIGQDFAEMANQADVMSAMIYPSHWAKYSFDLEKPDLEPYELVKRYLTEEEKIFSKLDHKPQSRPWLQDFTATWIGQGNYMVYDKDAVEAQIKAVRDMGQKEYLIWNASGQYTQGVDY
ncbi:MAG: putative glycoside hydrolase [Peptoniphilaceae bacterium]|nr:putative glycoside hydrolase [Peptoniphilaceae bacterium]MDY6018440.1 putative glycoside hydrolase [Anaerococcus sp.]